MSDQTQGGQRPGPKPRGDAAMFDRLLTDYCLDRGISLSQLQYLLPGYSNVEIWEMVTFFARQDTGPFPGDYFTDQNMQPGQRLTGQHCGTNRDYGLYTYVVEHLFRTYTLAHGIFNYFDQANLKLAIDRRLNLEHDTSSPLHITNLVLLAAMEVLLQCYKEAQLSPWDCQWFAEDDPAGAGVPPQIRDTIGRILKESYPLCQLISEKLFHYE
ncbi:hypothetical protein PspLS_11088 [Pyricularia sp. CBS 133598]|nr:hypothetical protein PspLS_11088 [Pyricularia sp. CBS 133598]